ncbi:uncharacterized protein LOC115648315 [Gopherus evgoodei]|uniref:uncharacterized protein LOC115648315 n=1 Tax=Gopherus evgoodei TaxID=1825980 RepID=UPI0011CF465B|nr:uncharacterized protein LOC115648315 [Gopherus evgoodei]XP_030411560.1 uncharacterized protein LOC115648315 [Gopherus evgoodei]XP_030411561.1 uncharacterized protein LOC115648315 [Gopherus evgoodei]
MPGHLRLGQLWCLRRLTPTSRCCWGEPELELELPGPPLSGEMAKDKRHTQRTWRGKEESEPTAAALPRPKDAPGREDNAQPTLAQLPPGSRGRGLFSQGWAPLVFPPAPRCNKLRASATEQDAAGVRSAATVPPEVLKIGSNCRVCNFRNNLFPHSKLLATATCYFILPYENRIHFIVDTSVTDHRCRESSPNGQAVWCSLVECASYINCKGS